jgi:hypothetical protein
LTFLSGTSSDFLPVSLPVVTLQQFGSKWRAGPV